MSFAPQKCAKMRRMRKVIIITFIIYMHVLGLKSNKQGYMSTSRAEVMFFLWKM